MRSAMQQSTANQNSLIMLNRIDTLKQAKAAINSFAFNPTQERKDAALAALKNLQAIVDSVHITEAAPAKPKRKAKRKPAAKRKAAPKRAKAKRSTKNDKLEAQAQAHSRGIASTYVQPEAVAEPKTVRKIEGDAPDILAMCGGDPVAAARHAKHMALTQIFSEDCIDMDDVL